MKISMDFLLQWRGKLKRWSNHYRIAEGTQAKPISFHLVVEDKIIPCGRKCESAFVNLFSSFSVFRTQYPPAFNF
jgi:hypothetical protein